MKNTIYCFLLMSIILSFNKAYAQANVNDYFVIVERYSHTEGYILASYDMEMNRLGRIGIDPQDYAYYYTTDHVYVYTTKALGSIGAIYQYNRELKLVDKLKFENGFVNDIYFLGDFILIEVTKGFTSHYYTYSLNLNLYGSLKRKDTNRYLGINGEYIIIGESNKSSKSVSKKMHLYDKWLELEKTIEVQK